MAPGFPVLTPGSSRGALSGSGHAHARSPGSRCSTGPGPGRQAEGLRTGVGGQDPWEAMLPGHWLEIGGRIPTYPSASREVQGCWWHTSVAAGGDRLTWLHGRVVWAAPRCGQLRARVDAFSPPSARRPAARVAAPHQCDPRVTGSPRFLGQSVTRPHPHRPHPSPCRLSPACRGDLLESVSR